MTTRHRMTASKFLAKRASDPAWVARRQRAEEADAASALDEERATRILLDDLRSVGVHVKSVWDIVNRSEPYYEALPILARHLVAGEFDSGTMEGIGRALAVKPAIAYWDTLRSSFLTPRSDGERTGSAVALAAAAKRENFSELAALVLQEPPIPDAIFFLSALVRIDRERAWPLIEALAEHPEFDAQARKMLKARESRRQRAEQNVR